MKDRKTSKSPPNASARRKKPNAEGARVDGFLPKQAAFVAEYLISGNATKAAIAAGYSPKTAYKIGAENLRKPQIAAYLAQKQKERGERCDISQDRVLKEVWNIATADPRELVEHRVGCCRYCWGVDFRYQRTAGEMEAAREAHDEAMASARRKPVGPFNEKGGGGYLVTRAPNADCPECGGIGVGRTIVKDTRGISVGAASLFAGVKETKEGIEIKLHPKDAALEKLMRHMGMFKDKVDVNLEGDFVTAMINARSRAANR